MEILHHIWTAIWLLVCVGGIVRWVSMAIGGDKRKLLKELTARVEQLSEDDQARTWLEKL